MCTALKETGFIRVRVPKAQGQIAEDAFKEAAQFFEQPSEEKLKTTFYASVDSFRMVGYDKVGRRICFTICSQSSCLQQKAREFYQVRRGEAMVSSFDMVATMAPGLEKAVKAAFDIQVCSSLDVFVYNNQMKYRIISQEFACGCCWWDWGYLKRDKSDSLSFSTHLGLKIRLENCRKELSVRPCSNCINIYCPAIVARYHTLFL